MEKISILPEKEIGNVICDWKIESVDVEVAMFIPNLFLSWPLTKCQFSLGVNWKKNQLSGTYFYVTKLDDSAPFELSGTISIVTAEKTAHVLGQFENHRFDIDKEKMSSMDISKFQCWKDILVPNNSLNFRIHLWKPSVKNEVTVKYHVSSRCVKQKCNFEWIVKSETDDSGKECFTKYVIEVPRGFHSFKTNKDFLMQMSLEFGKSSDADVRITLTIETPSRLLCWAKFRIDAISEEKISLLNTQFILLDERKTIHRCPKTEALQAFKSNKLIYYPKVYLKLHCNVTVMSYPHAVVEDACFISDYQSPDCDTLQTPLQEQIPSEGTLKDCMYTLYRKGEFCDVTLCTEEKKFPCHKAVLCARSSVFKAMFENDMSEKENGLVNLLDVDTRALGLFLTALYTDRLDGVDWKCALNVYAIADKYAVSAIQKMCRAFLVPKLSTSNVCEVLELADTHQDKELKLQVQEFVCKHAKEIIKSAEWSELTSRNSSLTAQVMQLIISERL